MLEDNPNLFDNTDARNDKALQLVIYDWYRNRRVTSNKRFPLYFQRVLNADYSRYRQLLRIEAGRIGDTGKSTEYDWLITNYYEGERNDLYSHIEHRNDSSVSADTSESISSTNDSGSDVTSSVSDENTTSKTASNNYSNTKSSSESDTSGNGSSATASRNGSISRANPMTQDFTSDDMSYNNDTGIGIGTNGDVENNSKTGLSMNGFNKDFPRLHIKNPTTTSDAFASGGSINKSNSSSITTGDTDTSNVGTTESSGTGASTSTSVVNYGRENSASNNSTGVSSTDSEGTSNSNTDSLSRSINTGRNGEIAGILSRARTYITSSSAWYWFMGRLDTCFMAIYDEWEDDYE